MHAGTVLSELLGINDLRGSKGRPLRLALLRFLVTTSLPNSLHQFSVSVFVKYPAMDACPLLLRLSYERSHESYEIF